MRSLTAFVLLVLLAEPALAAEAAPYAVVRRDGTVTWLKEKPARKGGNLVGRLAPTGQLVSFPLADVDEARTAEANRPTATPTPVSGPFHKQRVRTPTPVPGKKLKVPRSDAEKKLSSASGTGKKADAREAAELSPDDGGKKEYERVPDFEPTDRYGHGEDYWRPRADRARERLAAAQADLRRAQEASDRWDRSSVYGSPAWAVESSRLRTLLDRARLKAEREQQRWDDLAEEARKAGAYPGWLR